MPRKHDTKLSQAHWIWTAHSRPNQWVTLRRSFLLETLPTLARVTLAVDSKYWLYVNDQLVVFEGGLKRGPTPTDTYCDEVDLTPMLVKGQNTIAVLVWYFGKNGFSHQDSGAGGLFWDAPFLVSDTAWRAIEHPGYLEETAEAGAIPPNYRLPESNIHYDARCATLLQGWETSTYDDRWWEPAVLYGPRGSSPWHHLVPRPIPFFHWSDCTLYTNARDLPQTGGTTPILARLPTNLQVTPMLSIDAPAGRKIGIRTDHWQDGSEPNVQATYITTQGEQTFEALGWMSGTTVEYTIPAGVTIRSLSYRASGYATERLGQFRSSDPFLTRLWEKSARTVYLNLRDTFFDCPTRERAQWWGDVVNEQLEGFYLFDRAFYALCTKAISELVQWQRPDGVLFSPIPAGNWTQELPQQMLGAIWSFWITYLTTGDASFFALAYPALKRYLLLWELDGAGRVKHRSGDWDLPDWGTEIDASLLDTAWYALALASASKIAGVLEQEEDRALWQERQTQIVTHFPSAFWDASSQAYRSPDYTGATDDRGNALAVLAGLVPPTQYPAVRQVLLQQQHASPYLELYVLWSLYHMGYAEDAEARMKSRYAPMVADRGETVWELWEKRPEATDNHGWAAAPVFVLSALAAGVQPLAPGYTDYQVVPQMGTQTSLEVAVPTPKGMIHLRAERQPPQHFTMNLTSPQGTRAHLSLPMSDAPSCVLTINGTLCYERGAVVHMPPGIACERLKSDDLVLTVAPGTWTIAVTG